MIVIMLKKQLANYGKESGFAAPILLPIITYKMLKNDKGVPICANGTHYNYLINNYLCNLSGAIDTHAANQIVKYDIKIFIIVCAQICGFIA
jgi:hypothetical protein